MSVSAGAGGAVTLGGPVALEQFDAGPEAFDLVLQLVEPVVDRLALRLSESVVGVMAPNGLTFGAAGTLPVGGVAFSPDRCQLGPATERSNRWL
jgi:hypothetical protein